MRNTISCCKINLLQIKNNLIKLENYFAFITYILDIVESENVFKKTKHIFKKYDKLFKKMKHFLKKYFNTLINFKFVYI